MNNKNTNYRSRTNRLYETVLNEGSSPVYVIKSRKFLAIPLAILCIILAAFFMLIAVATDFEPFMLIVSLIFALIATFALLACLRVKVTIDSSGISYVSLFKKGRFNYSDVEKYITEAIKQNITYYSFIKIPVGTEHMFNFYLKGRKLPLVVPLVYDSRSARFIEDCLIETELTKLEALLQDENEMLKWQDAFLKSLKDPKVIPNPQLFGLRHLLINALYISGQHSPYYTFSGSLVTLLEFHVEYWLKEGYLTNIEDNWQVKWYSEFPSDWKEQWLSCIEDYVSNHTDNEDLNRIKVKINCIKERL